MPVITRAKFKINQVILSLFSFRSWEKRKMP